MSSARVVAAKKAVQLMGGPVKAARDLGIDGYQTIQSWAANGVPVAHCLKVEQLLGGAMSRKDLRPDDWAVYWPDFVEPQKEAA